MQRPLCTLPVFVALALTLTWAASRASLATEPTASTPAATSSDILPGFPHPPDVPASLLQPAAPTYEGDTPAGPYFQRDPLLDPLDMAQPGWLFDVEVDLIGNHVLNQLANTVALPLPGHGSDPVSVPMARLDWTAAPRFELGYRLPSGFGEIVANYRFLSTSGRGSTPGPDTTAALTSNLDLNAGDLDYASREWSLGPEWGMKWRIGARAADVRFASIAEQPFAAAAAGSGILQMRIANEFYGIGPHAALELQRRPNDWGLGLVGRLDTALLFGTVHQHFEELSTTAGPGGLQGGQSDLQNAQQVPVLGGFLGLEWRPRWANQFSLQLGYMAEYWWNIGRISDPPIYNGQSAGELGTHGVVLRLECNY